MKDRSKTTSPKETRIDEAAGGVVTAMENGTLYLVLIATPFGKGVRWSLPKGHFKKHESSEQAALREVHEETGLIVRLRAPLETIDYWFIEKRIRYNKFVHYYLMEATGGNLADHDNEVVEARWFDWDEALKKMAYVNDRRMVEFHRETIFSDSRERDAVGRIGH
jgi:8-oxo-dGTP pyrophosphatase MutT (NUDIX family)